MSTTAAKLLTAEDFWLLPDTEMRRTLVRGEVVDEMPVGGEHAGLAVRIVRYLERWAEEQDAGWIGVEAGFILARNPDLVRAPDVAFVRADDTLTAPDVLPGFARPVADFFA